MSVGHAAGVGLCMVGCVVEADCVGKLVELSDGKSDVCIGMFSKKAGFSLSVETVSGLLLISIL